MAILTGPRAAPRSGETRSLVIFLHGYGADGNDLLGLAQPLGAHLPDTAFRSPNAPQRCAVNPGGYQWFPIPWIDGSDELAMRAGFREAARKLDAYLAEAMTEEGVGPEQTALVGFSQGTMMALHVAPRRERGVACIVGFSGRLLEGEKLKEEALAKPPVLLVHGDQDEMIPVGELSAAREGLAAAGFSVEWHVSQSIGHGIAPDGLQLALGFLGAHLGPGGAGAGRTGAGGAS